MPRASDRAQIAEDRGSGGDVESRERRLAERFGDDRRDNEAGPRAKLVGNGRGRSLVSDAEASDASSATTKLSCESWVVGKRRATGDEARMDDLMPKESSKRAVGTDAPQRRRGSRPPAGDGRRTVAGAKDRGFRTSARSDRQERPEWRAT